METLLWLKNIPVGLWFIIIELYPGNGGKLCRGTWERWGNSYEKQILALSFDYGQEKIRQMPLYSMASLGRLFFNQSITTRQNFNIFSLSSGRFIFKIFTKVCCI